MPVPVPLPVRHSDSQSRQFSCAYHCMVLLTPRHRRSSPCDQPSPVLSEHGFRSSGHLPYASFHSLPMHWVTAEPHWRLNYLLQVLFGQLLGQHRLIGLHGVPDNQVLEAGGVLIHGDFAPGPGRNSRHLHHASFQDVLHSERPVTFICLHSNAWSSISECTHQALDSM